MCCRKDLCLCSRPDWRAVQAEKVVAHLQKKGKPESEDGPSTGPFVWKKKVEKQLQDGASVRELTAAAAAKHQEDRLVRSHSLGSICECHRAEVKLSTMLCGSSL